MIYEHRFHRLCGIKMSITDNSLQYLTSIHNDRLAWKSKATSTQNVYVLETEIDRVIPSISLPRPLYQWRWRSVDYLGVAGNSITTAQSAPKSALKVRLHISFIYSIFICIYGICKSNAHILFIYLYHLHLYMK